MKGIILFAAFLILSGIPLPAQENDSANQGFFIPRDFGHYFVSDIYSPVTKLELGLGSNGGDYNNDPGRTNRRLVFEEFTLGADIPLYSGQFQVHGEAIKFAVSTSLSSVVWFDFLNPKSAPILNADYRLSFPEFQLLKKFQGKYLKNILIRFIPLQHESTHLGDELTLYRREAGFPITRIDVSYETCEFSIVINDPSALTANNHSLSTGGRFLYKTHEKDGYYSMQTWEGDPNSFVPSWRRVEGYLRYQYNGSASHLRIGRFYPVLSAELRQRVKYGYPSYEPDPAQPNGYREISSSEKYVPCFNFYAGWRDQGNPGQKSHLGGYFRCYSGINPHGQFRNLPRYTFFGVALIYEK